MCKHVAAVLYGVGARFDHQPELLFTLCQVDVADLLSKAGSDLVCAAVLGERTLAEDEVSALFGLDMDGPSLDGPSAVVTPTPPTPPITSTARKALAARSPQAPARVARKAEPAPRPAKPTARARTPAARLLAALRRASWLDNSTARAATGLDAQAVRLLLKQLVADGHARVEGQRRATRYVAVEPRLTP
jgi:uncharacterized Zn finger protein